MTDMTEIKDTEELISVFDEAGRDMNVIPVKHLGQKALDYLGSDYLITAYMCQ